MNLDNKLLSLLKIKLSQNITQKDIAQATKLSKGYISKIVSGNRKASLEIWEKISEYLGAPIEDFIVEAKSVSYMETLEVDNESTNVDNNLSKDFYYKFRKLLINIEKNAIDLSFDELKKIDEISNRHKSI